MLRVIFWSLCLMLMQAGPPNSMDDVMLRSTQHRQPEVWHKHFDCGVVDRASGPGKSQDSSVSVVYKRKFSKIMC